MRTAEEILMKYGTLQRLCQRSKWNIQDAINEARKEAIEECAKRAKTKLDFGHKSIESAYVDKQSILSLINELK